MVFKTCDYFYKSYIYNSKKLFGFILFNLNLKFLKNWKNL